MHKYWGKKPANDLNTLIELYSKEHETVLDPFSGYGVFCCEAYLLNRNVISNDLNPVASFLNTQLLEKDVDLNLLKAQWKDIKNEFEPFIKQWYSWNINNTTVELISVLRTKENIPIKAKYKVDGQRKAEEIYLNSDEVLSFLKKEENFIIDDWYPDLELIENSRISAKKKMRVSDLFTKRTLACHAKLLTLIEKYSSGNEENLLKVAFTSNLANCSKLVPPIKSRGQMAPGAWMTGFYTGETYLENNVLQYFENRVNKLIKGKEDYLAFFSNKGQKSLTSKVYNNSYTILNEDVKKLSLNDESVDYIFTDPPYGDAVPYFEQSIIWNSWLKLVPDYINEIVISDSKTREKKSHNYEKEIFEAFSEIRRVLKINKYFSLTYHSLSGTEWKAITNACIMNGFEMIDFKLLEQKSFTPRQINRMKTIKGDVLVTFKKIEKITYTKNSDQENTRLFLELIKSWLDIEELETNEIFLRIMKKIFTERIIIDSIDIFEILLSNFKLNENKTWSNK